MEAKGSGVDYEKILDVIAEDATGRGYMKDTAGAYCAIGGLLKAASVEDARLILRSSTNGELRKVLRDEYGLELRRIVTPGEIARVNERLDAAGLTVPRFLLYPETYYDLEDLITAINDWTSKEELELGEEQELARRRARLRQLFLALRDVETAQTKE